MYIGLCRVVPCKDIDKDIYVHKNKLQAANTNVSLVNHVLHSLDMSLELGITSINMFMLQL